MKWIVLNQSILTSLNDEFMIWLQQKLITKINHSIAWQMKPSNVFTRLNCQSDTVYMVLHSFNKIRLNYSEWNLTYPDTSVPKLTVQKTEYPDKRVTFYISNYNWFLNMCPDKVNIPDKWGPDKWGFTVYVLAAGRWNYKSDTNIHSAYPNIRPCSRVVNVTSRLFERKKFNVLNLVSKFCQTYLFIHK